jgi:hypothetical protein
MMDRNACASLQALEEFCAWQGSDFGGAPSYLAGFDMTAQAELLGVLPALRPRQADPTPLRRADVPLRGLTAQLAEWRDQVVYGRGFVLLRRLPIERMAMADIGLGFAALCAHLGRTPPTPRTLFGQDCRIGLGTGPSDLTALLCLSEPDQGFELKIASTVAIHNVMAAETPELLAKLYLGAAPAFVCRGKQLLARLSPEAKAHAPALARAEASALTLDFEPGDVLLLNNHHTVFGLAPRGEAARGGRLLQLALESSLVAARPQPVATPAAAAWTGKADAESQAAA